MTLVYSIHNDGMSDALADDQHVCPTAQPFVPSWNTPEHTHLKRVRSQLGATPISRGDAENAKI